jgi:hypothetical protein
VSGRLVHPISAQIGALVPPLVRKLMSHAAGAVPGTAVPSATVSGIVVLLKVCD